MTSREEDKESKNITVPLSQSTTDNPLPLSQKSLLAHLATENADNDPRQKEESRRVNATSDETQASTPDEPRARPRQVIAVSASKGPAAFFNLARKFLVTDDTCDLSALEGAIVSAADAAHLLERSKLATIIRVKTSYVTVEPKRRRQDQPPQAAGMPSPTAPLPSLQTPPKGRATSGREPRRARIVITVQRTEAYREWLEQNPLQAVIAGDGDDVGEEGTAAAVPLSTSEEDR